MSDEHRITLTVDGEIVFGAVEPRKTLLDFLRTDVGRTGVHAGCEHGVCGACTVIVDGLAVRSCLMFAVQTDGTSLVTVHGLADTDGDLSHVQQVMHEEHALQCGFCTPGILMTLTALTQRDPPADEYELRAAMSGHLCRCTGYQGILRVVGRLSMAGADRQGKSQ